MFENKWGIRPCSLNENVSTFLRYVLKILRWRRRAFVPPECAHINNYPYGSYVIISRMERKVGLPAGHAY
jgi:hypothetical protein